MMIKKSLKTADNCFSLLPGQFLFWFGSLIVWFSVLWHLSSTTHVPQNGQEIPHLDKVMHFGYFSIGGFITFICLHKKASANAKKLLFFSVVLVSCIGLLDEFHQSFTPGRFGNDLGDWIADTLGSLAGGFYAFAMQRRMKETQG